MAFLDESGLSYLWNKLKDKFLLKESYGIYERSSIGGENKVGAIITKSKEYEHKEISINTNLGVLFSDNVIACNMYIDNVAFSYYNDKLLMGRDFEKRRIFFIDEENKNIKISHADAIEDDESTTLGQVKALIAESGGGGVSEELQEEIDDKVSKSDTGVQTLQGNLVVPTATEDNQASNLGQVKSLILADRFYETVSLTSSGWVDNIQTVTVTGVSATETEQVIQPIPAIESQSAYIEAGIYASGQAENQVTFTCTTVPTADMTVYVFIQRI